MTASTLPNVMSGGGASTGTGSPNRYYTLVSQAKKKKTVAQTRAEKKKAAMKANAGNEEFMNAMNPEQAGTKQGADALNLDHGFYNFVTMTEFHRD